MDNSIEELTIEETIIKYIFDEIFDNKFKPGMKLSESVFAQTFNVSRDSVRKAFSQLQSMGILTYKKNQGFYLRWLNEEDAKNVYEARTILEVGIITVVTQKYSLGLIELSSLVCEVEREKYLKISSRNGEYVNSSCNFHLELALLTNNELLINAITPLISLSILARLVYEDSTCLFNSYDEHNEIITAIKTNDVEYAKSVMNYHLRHCLEALNFKDTPKQTSSIISLRTML
ncbi:transcriptional regulator, GntR family [Arcobacter nitrofigilis DSM 7299]|uniref:Transcriptional regulator, GntR family n=1 Tax=Arcobacter nitrofigilis (strain ATCC 33309 / DSM 7299 / CCUG 15893 / LMG 7604 / NCTC 12251 / CI) TaxID=572480 RepID=D5V3E7_ARCNC|nr:GntR family transcriptional regulator [Arcobacter nitrofigilis]ADG92729.1 transcriptional regulator, GntR family [Arcobacter nitrofigilis DSM 7299]